jgi:hypothetical protein
MSETGHAEQQTYWNQLVLVKVVSCYVRRYRDEQAWWINRIGFFKAIVMSGTIGAWAIWKDYAFVWGVLLGIAQVVDAAKEYIPQQSIGEMPVSLYQNLRVSSSMPGLNGTRFSAVSIRLVISWSDGALWRRFSTRPRRSTSRMGCR